MPKFAASRYASLTVWRHSLNQKKGSSLIGRGLKSQLRFQDPGAHMSYSLNSLKGGYIGDCIGHYYRGYQGGY